MNYSELDRYRKIAYDWAKKRNFAGPDLFDGLLSPYADKVTLNIKVLRQIWQTFFKISPFNFRKVLKIGPVVIPKTYADFISGLISISSLQQTQEYNDDITVLADKLLDSSIDGYSGRCWGVGLKYQSRSVYATPKIPNIFTTYYCGMALLDLYEYFHEDKYLMAAYSIKNFIIKDIKFSKQKQGICFNYFPHQEDMILNVNTLTAAFLARLHKYFVSDNLIDLFAFKAVDFTLSKQTETGAWFYGENVNQKWIDNFHTGYILEGLFLFNQYSGMDIAKEHFIKGKQFFVDHFFYNDEIPKFYSTKLYPIDIQCIAQSIVVLNLIIDNKCRKILKKVIEWTFQNMFSRDGSFYYQKHKFWVNRLPYIRWGQSPMFRALSSLKEDVF